MMFQKKLEHETAEGSNAGMLMALYFSVFNLLHYTTLQFFVFYTTLHCTTVFCVLYYTKQGLYITLPNPNQSNLGEAEQS